MASLDGRSLLADAATAIDIGCHMSYPFAFEYAGSIWCAPEISERGGLKLFQMGERPWEWHAAEHALPDLPLIDPTLFEHGGRWWLFACLAGEAKEGELHAWYAASPLGSWTPHLLNPIKIDAGSSRPAGAPFRTETGFYRPGQDCSKTYGGAVVLHQILRLDPEGFEEVAVARVEPGIDWPYRDGLHTFNPIEGSVIFDAKRHVFSLPGSLSAMRALLPWRRRRG
ncbi:MAG: hypothetical protein JO122_18775 [Acetobacteraceae bacterium]|nr:hypothetical protein [Acetobacteraceae bacterium]